MKLFYSLQGGRSPLLVAIEKGHTDVIDILVTHDADVNTEDDVRNILSLYTSVSILYL